MFILERKELYIVPESLTKNRTCQSFRWKQYAMCEEREPLDEMVKKQRFPDNWRVIQNAAP